MIESGVKHMEAVGNNPHAFIEKTKSAGIRIVHKYVALRHALSAERNGVDAVSIDGFKRAGYPGEDDVPGAGTDPAGLLSAIEDSRHRLRQHRRWAWHGCCADARRERR